MPYSIGPSLVTLGMRPLFKESSACLPFSGQVGSGGGPSVGGGIAPKAPVPAGWVTQNCRGKGWEMTCLLTPAGGKKKGGGRATTAQQDGPRIVPGTGGAEAVIPRSSCVPWPNQEPAVLWILGS